jgi:hypothetical protein
MKQRLWQSERRKNFRHITRHRTARGDFLFSLFFERFSLNSHYQQQEWETQKSAWNVYCRVSHAMSDEAHEHNCFKSLAMAAGRNVFCQRVIV